MTAAYVFASSFFRKECNSGNPRIESPRVDSPLAFSDEREVERHAYERPTCSYLQSFCNTLYIYIDHIAMRP